MSKILKASYVNIDEHKLNIDVPNFENDERMLNFRFDNEFQDDNEFQGDEEFPFDDEFGVSDFEESFEITDEEKISEAELKANEIIESAQMEASQIILNANSEADTIRQNTFEESKDEGYKAGYDEAMAEVEALKNEALAIKQSAVDEKQELIDGVEPELINLVINVLDKIFKKSVDINPQIIIALIKEGISNATVTGDLFVHVSSDDYDTVVSNKKDILALTDGNTNIEIIKDLSLNKGDCIIETPFGNIDCSLERQFQGLKQGLYYILENR